MASLRTLPPTRPHHRGPLPHRCGPGALPRCAHGSRCLWRRGCEVKEPCATGWCLWHHGDHTRVCRFIKVVCCHHTPKRCPRLPWCASAREGWRGSPPSRHTRWRHPRPPGPRPPIAVARGGSGSPPTWHGGASSTARRLPAWVATLVAPRAHHKHTRTTHTMPGWRVATVPRARTHRRPATPGASGRAHIWPGGARSIRQRRHQPRKRVARAHLTLTLTHTHTDTTPTTHTTLVWRVAVVVAVPRARTRGTPA